MLKNYSNIRSVSYHMILVLFYVIINTLIASADDVLLPPPTSSKQIDNMRKVLKDDMTQSNKYGGFVEKPKLQQSEKSTEQNTVQTPNKKVPSNDVSNAKITIGVNRFERVFYPLASSICLFMNEKNKESCHIKRYNNAVDAITAMLSGDVDVAIVRSVWEKNIIDGNKPFDKTDQYKKLRFVASFYDEPLAIVTRKNSYIRVFDDTKDQTINLGKQGTATEIVMKKLLEVKGWDNRIFKSVTALDVNDQAKALCNGNIDVMVVVAECSNQSLKDVTRACETNIASVNARDVDAIVSKNKEYKNAKIAGGTYLGSPTDVETIAVKPVILTTSDITDAQIYKLIGTIFSNIDHIKSLHQVFDSITLENMINDAHIVPLHDGVTNYLKNNNHGNLLAETQTQQ